MPFVQKWRLEDVGTAFIALKCDRPLTNYCAEERKLCRLRAHFPDHLAQCLSLPKGLSLDHEFKTKVEQSSSLRDASSNLLNVEVIIQSYVFDSQMKLAESKTRFIEPTPKLLCIPFFSLRAIFHWLTTSIQVFSSIWNNDRCGRTIIMKLRLITERCTISVVH